jgi:hypothetical protein
MRLLILAIARENLIDYNNRLSIPCSLDTLKAEATREIRFLNKAIAFYKSYLIDILRGG